MVSPIPARGLEFAEHHVEATIAGDRDDRGFRRRERGPDPAGQPIADRSQAAVRDEMPTGDFRIVEEPGPMRCKPAIGDEDALRRQGAIEFAT